MKKHLPKSNLDDSSYDSNLYSEVKASTCNAGDPGSNPSGNPGFPNPGSGKSPGEGNGNPPVFVPGESRGGRSLVGYSARGGKESDRAERLHFHHI